MVGGLHSFDGGNSAGLGYRVIKEVVTLVYDFSNFLKNSFIAINFSNSS